MSEQEKNEKKAALSRRRLLQATGLGVAGAALGGLGISSAHAAMGPKSDLVVQSDGRYPVAPLSKDTISLGVAQTRVRAVDGKSPKKGMKENLDHMLLSID